MTTTSRRLRALRDRLIGAAHTGLVIYLYNLDNHRPDAQVAREIRAILATRPDALDLVECVGNYLPDVDGYRLVRNREDTRRRERANIASYVREDHLVTGVDWIDLDGVWRRPKGPGIHEARSFLVYRLDGIVRIVGHQAPRSASNWAALQAEGNAAVVRRLNGWRNRTEGTARRVVEGARPRILTWDGNAVVGDHGPNPAMVADAIGGRVVNGRRIDHAIVVGVRGASATVLSRVGGVQLESDHKRIVRFDFTVPAVFVGTTWRLARAARRKTGGRHKA